MNKADRQKIQGDWVIWVLIVYLLLGFLQLKVHRYEMNPDGISYIAIAQKYLVGNFHDAINAVWSPFFSWLLVPMLALGVEPLLAPKILNVILGVPILLLISRLSQQFSLTVWTRRVLLFSLVPILLSMSVLARADLCGAIPLLIYFLMIFRPQYPAALRQGAWCGFWGGIAYLAKVYAFPFFISHFLLMNGLHYLRHETREKKRQTLASLCCGFIVFGLVSGLWIAALSTKYHRFTFSNVPKLIVHSKSPDFQSISVQPQGLISPPNPTAVALNEDYSLTDYHLSDWTPLGSWGAFKHYTRVITRQWIQILYFFQSFSCLSITICLTYILFLLHRPRELLVQYEVVYPFVTLLLFCSGYSMIHVTAATARFLWVPYFLLVLMGGYTLDRLIQDSFFTKARRAVLYVAFVACFAFTPIMNMWQNRNEGKPIYLLSHMFKDHIRPGDRIASDTEWARSLFLAFYLNARYYSTAGTEVTEQKLENDLRRFGIQHYLVWGESTHSHMPLPGYQPVEIAGVTEPKLYSLVAQSDRP
jgi:hypothetical protein